MGCSQLGGRVVVRGNVMGGDNMMWGGWAGNQLAYRCYNRI